MVVYLRVCAQFVKKVRELRRRSSNAMPREVREAIAWCISGEDMTEEAAGAYVERMFDEGRGGEESW